MKTLTGIWDYLFGCAHQNHTWPITKAGKTHVACLDCGTTLAYDFENLGKESGIVPPRITAPRRLEITQPCKMHLLVQHGNVAVDIEAR